MSSNDIHPPVNAVVFDIGGVLLDWDPRYLYRKLFDNEADMEYFLSNVCTMEWHHDNDLGVPLEETCGRLAAAHPEYAEMIWAWGQRSEEMVGGEIEASVGVLRELHATGIRCYALTNHERWTFPLRRKRFAFFDCFDGAVVSSHEGVAKPDQEIFRRVVERFNLDPGTTLLIDDAERNITAARGLGWQAIQFTSPAELRSALADLGLVAAG